MTMTTATTCRVLTDLAPVPNLEYQAPDLQTKSLRVAAAPSGNQPPRENRLVLTQTMILRTIWMVRIVREKTTMPASAISQVNLP